MSDADSQSDRAAPSRRIGGSDPTIVADPTTRFFIDRRLSPGNRSIGNRQRFLRRAREELKRSIDKTVRDIDLGDVSGPKTVTIPAKSIREPQFRLGPGGRRARVLPGNQDFVVGDKIGRPKSASGSGAGDGAAEGTGQDDFTFALTEDEFLDIFFDDLALPDLVQTSLRQTGGTAPSRAGHTSAGTATNLDVGQTMRRSFGRRLALGRPTTAELDELNARCDLLRSRADTEDDRVRLNELETELATLTRRRHRIPYIDPNDVRYRRFEQRPRPKSSAVMFCLMDVSASMDQTRKDLAKRFFLLLHLFLRSHYDAVDVVFIRHTTEAAEVDEETFCHGTETGGTKVSSALVEMSKIIEDRYANDAWNVYAAQASDGDSTPGDAAVCVDLLDDALLPLCQHFAYIEVATRPLHPWLGSSPSQLMPAYDALASRAPNFVTASVSDASQIYPVFRRLFHNDAEVRSS